MNYIISILPDILSGLNITIGLFIFTLIGATPLGVLMAIGMRSQFVILRWLLNAYVWIIRGTPLMLQLMFVYFGLPIATNNELVFPKMTAAVVVFILNYAGYLAEIFRGGIQAIPQGQYDAAQVLGISRGQTFRKIVLPQVFKIVLPSFGNEVINLIKDTSLGYVISLVDILYIAQGHAVADVTLLPYVIVAVLYLFFTALATLIVKKIEANYREWQ
ncbi:amino acid ABC transporter permease [Oenococcus sicerae]|uniref:Amino acid ABC transporter permease n=1 Tax=Oenococcus sicerae TaxID=2203724 RepID=A0AAJ1VME2_9LACO|nr:amino acid ABC transporter permease [Oenococcus sicerae]MDN6900473.1 amino acid ABC transporter permease [Oenococcus sicerae]